MKIELTTQELTLLVDLLKLEMVSVNYDDTDPELTLYEKLKAVLNTKTNP